MIRFLKDRMSSISSGLYEQISKPNTSHTNRIINMVPCNGGLTRNDLYDMICMTFIRFQYNSTNLNV